MNLPRNMADAIKPAYLPIYEYLYIIIDYKNDRCTNPLMKIQYQEVGIAP